MNTPWANREPTMRELIDTVKTLFIAGKQPSAEEAEELREAVRHLTSIAIRNSHHQDVNKLDDGFNLDDTEMG